VKYFAALVLAFASLLPIAASAAQKLVLTSSSATACTAFANPAKELLAVLNASTSAQTVTLSVYDESGTPTCASADLVYSVVLGASQVVLFPALPDTKSGWLVHGGAYKLSAAATNNIVILYQ